MDLFPTDCHDLDWLLKQSIVEAVAAQPNPSMIKLNKHFIEEFGYLPDDEVIDYFIDCIKNREVTEPDEVQDPHHEFTKRVAGEPNPSVVKFSELYENEFGTPPKNNLIKYFILAVNAANENTNRKDQAAFILAEKIAYGKNPTFKKLKKKFEATYNKPTSFALIDFFITKIIKKQQQ